MATTAQASSSRKTSRGPSKAPPAASTRTAGQATRKALPAKASKAAKPAAAKKAGARAASPGKPPVAKLKQKLVRDSFTMPQADFDLVDQLKARALAMMRPAKKSELLRAGLHALNALSDAHLKAVLSGLTPLKPGRPKKPA